MWLKGDQHRLEFAFPYKTGRLVRGDPIQLFDACDMCIEIRFTAGAVHVTDYHAHAADSIYNDLRLRGTDEWAEVPVKDRASNFVTTLLTSFTYDQA